MTLLLATIGYLVAATAIARVEVRHDMRTDMTPVQHWLHEEFFHPAMRALALLLFMVVGYKGIFGLPADAPMFTELLDGALLSQGFNLLFILPFLLALLPGTALFTPVLLPAQSVALTAITFSSLGRQLDIPVNLLPSAGVLPTLLVLALGGHFLARHLARWLPDHWRSHLRLRELGLLSFQLPLVLVYGRALGSQLAI